MKKLALAALVFLLALAAWGQNESIPVTYVSGLRAEVEGSAIKLLWTDTSIPGARYVVYRSTKELTESDWQQAQKLAVVPAGQQSYIDQPTDTRPYFYAVLVEDPSGKINALFIPFRNVTTEGVAIAAPAGEEGTFADVSSLGAARSGDSIELTFKSSQPKRELVIYRGTAPIVNESDLLAAVTVGVVPSSANSFEDTPAAGIPYYYAVVDSAMLASGKIYLVPGQNTTRAAVEVPIQTNAAGKIEYATKRPRPLPFLTLTNNLQSGAPLAGPNAPPVPTATPLSKTTAAAVDSLLGSLPPEKSAAMHPEILDAEKGVVSGGGEEYLLKGIVDGPLASGDWKKAQAALESYLNIRRPAAVEARARFYLGQAYYFDGQYRKSFLEFLFAEKAYYAEVQPWLDNLFTKLQTQNPGRS